MAVKVGLRSARWERLRLRKLYSARIGVGFLGSKLRDSEIKVETFIQGSAFRVFAQGDGGSTLNLVTTSTLGSEFGVHLRP